MLENIAVKPILVCSEHTAHCVALPGLGAYVDHAGHGLEGIGSSCITMSTSNI